MRAQHPIVVFSHLRWDFVYQRPQHVISRLARHRRVFYIEEPAYVDDMPPRWERENRGTNVTVMRSRTPIAASGFGGAQRPLLTRLVDALATTERLRPCIAWLYTPMAWPLARTLAPELVVYDCMDELSAFLGAPPELLTRETELLANADLLFTGGPSLYRSKRSRHPNVHCFPSSVDVPHFAEARNGLREAADQRALPHPRLGFFGVLDERLDVGLLEALAREHPEWQIVMAGPIAKIDPASLPRRPNIHYLGSRPYDALPSYVVGWDVCLLPFARNAATRFISPTKTLEYMAAGRPIVSTSIADVAEPYGDVVYVADDPAAFAAACASAMNADPAERARRQARADAVVASTSWDRTVAQMEHLLADVAAPAVPAARQRARS